MHRIFRLCSPLLLLIYFALGLDHITHASITFDEGPHLAVGYTTLRTGDFRLQPVHIHPPLANVLAAAPLLAQDDLPNPRDVGGWEINSLSAITDAVVWQYSHPARIATAGRVPILLVGVLLGALIHRCASDLGGRKAGLLALILYALDPNMIAHGSLITTDMVATFLIVATMYISSRNLGFSIADFRAGGKKQEYTSDGWKVVSRLLAIGSLLGLAQLAKVSALMLIPVVGFLLFLRTYRDVPPAHRASSLQHLTLRFTVHVLAVFLFAVFIVWAGYGFEIAAVPGFPIALPAATHIRIFLALRDHYDLGHPTFLQGQVRDHGWWTYFPIAFVLKTPLPTLLLAAWSLVRLAFNALRQTLHFKLRALSHMGLWLFPLLYAVSSLFSTVNIGYRHLLPVLPFLYIGIGITVSTKDAVRRKKLGIRNEKLADQESRSQRPASSIRRRAANLTFYALVVWLALGTVTLAPYYLTFFNELAGGATNGYRHLVDSNLDWGQNLWDLRRWMREHNESHVSYAHYSPARPDVYGIRADFLPPDPRAVDFTPWNPAPGLYAIGATVLQGPYAPDVNTYAWFRAREPDAVLGNALFVYRVPSQPVTEWAVLCADAGVSEQTLKRNLGVSELRVIWVDCAQVEVYPAGGTRGLYVMKSASPFAESRYVHLRTPDGQVSGGIHYIDSAPPTPLSPANNVKWDGPLTFLGYTMRGFPSFWAYWRVESIPNRPLSLMAHLIGPDGTAISVADGHLFIRTAKNLYCIGK